MKLRVTPIMCNLLYESHHYEPLILKENTRKNLKVNKTVDKKKILKLTLKDIINSDNSDAVIMKLYELIS